MTQTIEELSSAFLAAKTAATKASPGSDDGSCNLDSCLIKLPRLKEAFVKQAAQAAGVGVQRIKWAGYGSGWFWLLIHEGQGFQRTRMVEAACEALKSLGHNAVVHYLTD